MVVSSTSPLLAHLTPSDQQLFVRYGFGKEQVSPFGCIHHAFEYHVSRTPEAIAVEHLDESITFLELDKRANRLAQRLVALGVRPGARVCMLMQRGIAMVIGILAVLKAGGQYVPLDGGIVTDSTLRHVLTDSGALLVLVLKQYASRVLSGTPVMCLEDVILEDERLAADSSKPTDRSSPSDGVYAIYTSGTTGKPKGVDVTHSNVTNLVCLSPGNVGMRPGLRVAQLLNIAFDMCAWEVLGSLANGCTLCVRGKSSKDWKTVLRTVDVVISTPSILAVHDPKDYPNVKYLATAGEPCPQSLADRWAEAGAQFHNSCGPTEITIVNTVHPHSRPGEPLSIGGPTPNNSVYVLDDNLKPVPIGEPGMMWAGGAGITRGYLNLPLVTGQRYKRDPYLNDGSRMFNTGDIGRWRTDGTLEHLGRADDQVKVKGFRVELDGVAVAMETCSGVRAAAALLVGQDLWGFITPDNVAVEDVKVACAKIQPYYAVPGRILALPEFVKTANGKIDKGFLRSLAEEASGLKVLSEAVAPNKRNSNLRISTEITKDTKAPASLSPSGVDTPPSSSSSSILTRRPPSLYSTDPSTRTPQSGSSTSSLTADLKEIPKHPFSISASEVEKGKGNVWDGYMDDTIPEKTQPQKVRNLRHLVFSLYRRLFGVVFITNMAVLIAIASRWQTRPVDSTDIGLIAVANIFVAVLMRQDHIINIFFIVFCAVPTSWPLSIRRICARVYHIGGLHSGAAISGTCWVVYLVVQVTIDHILGKTSIATMVVTYLILCVLLTIICFAYPTIRQRAHDNFEKTHRFLGWTAAALVWVQNILLTNDFKRPGETLGQALVISPAFWLVVVLTLSIILPWTKLRKVPVRSEVLSDHAVRLYFEYVTPIGGSFTRISIDPLQEWHSFATIPEPGMKGYSLVVSKAGDWTTGRIQDPPTELWVRGVPTFGVMRIAPLFKRLVVVATGSGIGPVTTSLLEQRVPIRLLWTSPDVRKTFGDKLVDSIIAAEPGAVIYDTRKNGKPDMVKLTYRLVKEFNAEAVCIISNQKLTQKVVYGMMSRGIPAFGAIWDS